MKFPEFLFSSNVRKLQNRKHGIPSCSLFLVHVIFNWGSRQKLKWYDKQICFNWKSRSCLLSCTSHLHVTTDFFLFPVLVHLPPKLKLSPGNEKVLNEIYSGSVCLGVLWLWIYIVPCFAWFPNNIIKAIKKKVFAAFTAYEIWIYLLFLTAKAKPLI